MFRIVPIEGGVTAVEGFYASGVKAGFKNDDYDVGYIYSAKVCDIAYTFTTNKFQAAPIKYVLNRNITKTNFILLNSKNANALTGPKGIEDIEELMQVCHEKFENLTNPIMSSTGVIGVRLDKEKIKKAIKSFELQKDNHKVSKAIMTTDTYPKTVAFEVILDNGSSFRIGAIAKGAGMINPAMATMLCFVVSDADITDDMNKILQEAVEISFNAISVDGDTSTNDSCFLMTSREGGYDKEAFREALKLTLQKLAFDIVKDAEGANKFVAFEIKGAKNKLEAQKIGKALSNSLLVKTAIFGEDPNWGRIASTIGASGCECDEYRLQISFENVLVYDRGEIYFDSQIEQKAAQIMQKDEFKIVCDLGIGDGEFTSYGCDLSYEYVKINADYRT
ncbi:MAG: bifunctional glutamate N-acetyltransferase/amino-acid acetyltransferase ArgJ [Epsilonproteobacteria bacterium]|nr:bifunctional glutamate N-acetyltransferase/amino-acid acetyltransferase ArgJ [Campylobacterota bacterium]